MVIEGEQAPDVALTMAGGVVRRIADWRGKTLVLYFYPKDDTSGCTAEAQAFSALAGDFAKTGAAVIGVSRDSPAKHAKFKAKYDLQVEFASDETGEACAAFGTWVEKRMYGRKYMGIERTTFLIDRDGKVARAWRKLKVPGHADEVLAVAKAL